MDYFIVFMLGAAAALWLLKVAVRRAIDRIMDQMMLDSQQSATSAPGVQLKVEFDQGTYFTYNTENSQFVCQADTVLQLRQRLSEMFPGQTATIVDGDPVVLAVLQKELENIK
jgi:hypothetical protein